MQIYVTHYICHQNFVYYKTLLQYAMNLSYVAIVTIIGASFSDPHHVRSTVKFVFLLACLYVCLYACHRLIWLSATISTLKAI